MAERSLKVGQLVHPLRFAVTGRTVGLGLYDALAILGRERSLARIRGHAYRDFATTEELKAERTAAEKEKRSFLYSRKWMAETDEDAQRFEAEGRQGVVRLKMPREGKCSFHDLVRGDVEFDWANEQDHVVSGPTARACITWRASSTTTTSRSRT